MRLEKEFLRVFPNSELPQFLERVITEPRLKLLDALVSDLEGVSLNVLVGVLICIFENKGKSLRLIQWCIRQEVSKCSIVSILISIDLILEEINTVFREDSIYSKILKSYMNMIGKNYLENVLLTTVRKVATTKESYEIVSFQGDYHCLTFLVRHKQHREPRKSKNKCKKIRKTCTKVTRHNL